MAQAPLRQTAAGHRKKARRHNRVRRPISSQRHPAASGRQESVTKINDSLENPAASQFSISAFYKGESQEKKQPRRLEGAKTFAALSSPSHVKDRKSTRLNSSHSQISYAVFC